MKNALWFSRHNPTAEQLADIEKMGFFLVAVQQGKLLGSIEIVSKDDVLTIVQELRGLAVANKATEVFGVWPVDFQHYFWRNRDFRALGCHGAANSKRTVEGQAPTFSHREWLPVGFLSHIKYLDPAAQLSNATNSQTSPRISKSSAREPWWKQKGL